LIPPGNARSGRSRQDFLKTFLHDLATPLSAVSLHLEGADRRIRRGADPAEALSVARAELAKAFELFERGRELLLSSPGEAKTFSFDEWVERTVVETAGEPVPVSGSTSAFVRADPRALSEAFRALLANALESAPAAAVSVRREREAGRVRVTVENPGRLPGGDFEKLFAPRAAGAGKNWGMGLARARLYVAGAGGEVRLAQKEEIVSVSLELPEERER